MSTIIKFEPISPVVTTVERVERAGANARREVDALWNEAVRTFNTAFENFPNMPDMRFPREFFANADFFGGSAFDRISTMFDDALATADGFTLRSDVAEDDHNVYLHIELPGMEKQDVAVTLTSENAENILAIKGERKNEMKEEGKTLVREERRHGTFERTFRLPSSVNTAEIRAEFTHGVLAITLPKHESAKPKTVAVEVK